MSRDIHDNARIRVSSYKLFMHLIMFLVLFGYRANLAVALNLGRDDHMKQEVCLSRTRPRSTKQEDEAISLATLPG